MDPQGRTAQSDDARAPSSSPGILSPVATPIRSSVFLIVVTSCVCFASATADAAERVDTWPRWQRRRVALDRRLVKDEFRVYYTLTGDDALLEEHRGDTDGDGVPDKVQNVALQLVSARRIFVDAMGLRHPFESPRYKDRVRFIDVHIWDCAANGSAGDGVVNYHRPSDPPEGVEVLTIDVHRRLGPRNQTPAHELFHHFQHGYTLFKNGWFTEGMCRWSEFALLKGAGKPDRLPATPDTLEELLSMRYKASGFWDALARETDRIGTIPVPNGLADLTYAGSETPVIEDNVLFGAALMKEVLEELDRMDDVVSVANGLDRLNWKEARQRSSENNPYVWAAVVNVCRRHADHAPALRKMVERLGAVGQSAPGMPR